VDVDVDVDCGRVDVDCVLSNVVANQWLIASQ